MPETTSRKIRKTFKQSHVYTQKSYRKQYPLNKVTKTCCIYNKYFDDHTNKQNVASIPTYIKIQVPFMYLSKAFPFFHKYWSHWVNAKTVFEAFVPKLQLNADLLMMCTCNNSKTIMNLARCCNYKQNVNMWIRNVDSLAASAVEHTATDCAT